MYSISNKCSIQDVSFQFAAEYPNSIYLNSGGTMESHFGLRIYLANIGITYVVGNLESDVFEPERCISLSSPFWSTNAHASTLLLSWLKVHGEILIDHLMARQAGGLSPASAALLGTMIMSLKLNLPKTIQELRVARGNGDLEYPHSFTFHAKHKLVPYDKIGEIEFNIHISFAEPYMTQKILSKEKVSKLNRVMADRYGFKSSRIDYVRK